MVRTPKLSAGGIGVGAAGVSINSKSSVASDAGFDIVTLQLIGQVMNRSNVNLYVLCLPRIWKMYLHCANLETGIRTYLVRIICIYLTKYV